MDESPAVVCDSGAVKLTAPPLCQEKCNGKRLQVNTQHVHIMSTDMLLE